MFDGMGFVPPGGRSGDVVISTHGDQSLGVELRGMVATTGGVAWPLGNIGLFVPFHVPESVTIYKLWFGISTFAACNVDIGIFLEDGTLVVSMGTTALVNSGVNTFDITDTRLARGRYYMGLCVDAVTAGLFTVSVPSAAVVQGLGVMKDTACAPPMSTNANPATFVTTTYTSIPLMGAQGYRTIGP